MRTFAAIDEGVSPRTVAPSGSDQVRRVQGPRGDPHERLAGVGCRFWRGRDFDVGPPVLHFVVEAGDPHYGLHIGTHQSSRGKSSWEPMGLGC